MMIYRPGAVTADQIRAVAGPVVYFEEKAMPPSAAPEALPSPGVGLRHYAPRARLILVEGRLDELAARMAAEARPYAKERLGVMLPLEMAPGGLEPPLRGAAEFLWGHWSAPEELAERVYAGLRALDAEGCSVILCPMPEGDGVGVAIRDRLRKAARSAKS
jgi:L-threonylcarbamoyladenylate synthase